MARQQSIQVLLLLSATLALLCAFCASAGAQPLVSAAEAEGVPAKVVVVEEEEDGPLVYFLMNRLPGKFVPPQPHYNRVLAPMRLAQRADLAESPKMQKKWSRFEPSIRFF